MRSALGLTPLESGSMLLASSIVDQSLVAQYRRRKKLLDVQFALESAGKFEIWTPLSAGTTVISGNGDGTETVIFRDNTPPDSAPSCDHSTKMPCGANKAHRRISSKESSGAVG